MTLLACPTAIHEEIKNDRHRARIETSPRGVQVIAPGEVLFLRNCNVCASTLALETDVDAAVSAQAPTA
jgi:hypothetical protein